MMHVKDSDCDVDPYDECCRTCGVYHGEACAGFRLNEGNVARHTTQRLDSFVDAVAGKRLTYRRLIA